MHSKVYIIEYRFYDTYTSHWISKVSQEGYSRYEDAKKFCEERSSYSGTIINPMYFQNKTIDGRYEEYLIHEVNIKCS